MRYVMESDELDRRNTCPDGRKGAYAERGIMDSRPLILVGALAQVGCPSRAASHETDLESADFGERCPAGTSVLPRSPEAHEPLRCAKPDGTPQGPWREYHFSETERSWSVSEGWYSSGRREGQWVTCAMWRGECVVAATRTYSRGELTAFHEYRPTRAEAREPDGTVRVSRYESPAKTDEHVEDACPEAAVASTTVLACDPHAMNETRFQEQLDRTAREHGATIH